MTNELFQRGLEIRREVVGAEQVNKSLAAADEFTRPFQDLATKYCWGEVWGRTGIDRKTRSVANIAMMVALNRPAELKIHVKGGLKNGLTRQEVSEILLQSAVYCGIPAAGDAFRNTKEAFAEVDAELAAASAKNTDAKPREVIGFIGLGAMGYPMATQLVEAGYTVKAFDINEVAVKKFDDEFKSGVATAELAVQDADFIITILPDSNAVAHLLFGVNGNWGIAKSMKQGATLIDMTSGDPAKSKELSKVLGERGVSMIDAPVSGGFPKARTGELAIMVGGPKEIVERCMPVLKVMGKSIVQVGDVGAGHAVKALNNYISAIGWLAVIEALHTGKKFGLDVSTMNKVFNSSSGRNSSTANKVEQAILSGTYDTGFSLALMAKDVGIAVGLAEKMDIEAQVGHLSYSIIQSALESSAEQKLDNSRLFDLLHSA